MQEFGYRFNEYNPDDKVKKAYPHFTSRVVTASSGRCNEYVQVGNPKRTIFGDPKGSSYVSALNYTYTNHNHSMKGSVVIPTSALGPKGTTYMYRDPQTPAKADRFRYGDRGIWIWVYNTPGVSDHPLFYECPITVDTVTNVNDPKHNITDQIAREAAASIALQGQYRGPGDDPDFTQWQWYANG